MFRSLIFFTCLVNAFVGLSHSQDILQGKIVSFDVEKRRVVVTIDGRDREFAISEQTRVLDAAGESLAERLKGFRKGSAVFVKPANRDDGKTLEGIKLAASEPAPGRVQEPGAPRQATLKSLDLKSRRVVLNVDGQDRERFLIDATQVRGASGSSLDDRLRAFKPGDAVLFLEGKRDDRDVLLGLAIASGPRQLSSRVMSETSHLKPLNELGQEKYLGSTGGLYPDGENERPKDHEAAGLRLAAQVRPLNAKGEPDDRGRVVMLSVGMSNTSQLSIGFEGVLRKTAEAVHPRFLFINGAQGAMTAGAIQNPDDGGRGQRYWTEIDRRLQAANITREQIQVIWIKQADPGPSTGFPEYARTLQAELGNIVRVARGRYPNLKLAYLSSRTYGGFAKTSLNPEPYAYESGFSVKWLIERQIAGDPDLNYDPAKGPVKAPWLSWGPYLWANGTVPRSDGFKYAPQDFATDGTHHTALGERKGGEQLLKFLQTDSTTRSWFLRP